MKLLTLLFFSLLCVHGFAQEVSKPRTCRVLFVSKPASAPEKAYLFDGQVSKEVILPSLNLSKVIELPPGNITVGFSPKPLVEGELFPPGAPKARIPENYSDIYMLLFPDPKNKVLPFKIKIVSIDGYRIKKGQTLWINTSKFQILGNTGQTDFVLPAFKLKVTDPPLRKHGFYLAKFNYRSDPKKKFLPVMKKNWWFDANSRHLGFIIDRGARMPRIYTMRDRRPPEPPTP